MAAKPIGQRLPPDPHERASMLREFAGCWIAVWKGVVVAAEQSADDVFKKLDELQLPDAAVRKIPERLDAIYVGLG